MTAKEEIEKFKDEAFNNRRVLGKLMSPYEHDIWSDGVDAGFNAASTAYAEKLRVAIEALEFVESCRPDVFVSGKNYFDEMYQLTCIARQALSALKAEGME